MLHAILTFAAEAAGEESSKAAFYISGTVLALWAVLLSFFGIRRHAEWPGDASGRGIMGISALLVVIALASAVITG